MWFIIAMVLFVCAIAIFRTEGQNASQTEGEC